MKVGRKFAKRLMWEYDYSLASKHEHIRRELVLILNGGHLMVTPAWEGSKVARGMGHCGC